MIAGPDDSDESNEDSDDSDDDCKLPPVQPGPFACSGYFPKWTFDAKSGSCKQFVYGGCRGTKNLFATEQECMAKCSKKRMIDNTLRSELGHVLIDGALISLMNRFQSQERRFALFAAFGSGHLPGLHPELLL